MSSPNGSDSEQFTPPHIELGDLVLYHENPTNTSNPVLGWVCRQPGTFTTYVLIFSPDQGFVEKPSVRHISDPGLQTNAAWRQWGAWEEHPTTSLLRRLTTLMPQLTALLARNGGKTKD
jgi:hypothetical protein